MNEPETTTSMRPDVDELKAECAALRHQATTLLLALLVLSGTFTVYLGLQARRANKDLETIRPQAAQIREASLREEPFIKDLAIKLAEFGRTHPDFMAVLNKYKIQIKAAPGAATNSAAPAASAPAAVTPKPSAAPKK